MSEALMPFLWAIFAFVILLLMQRWIHAHLHGVSLLLFRKPAWAVFGYAIILFPGVLLHEVSHWIMASLLGVRTGSFSILPRRQPDGSILLGYVEYYKGKTLDPIRESLVGGAPLLAGTAVILFIGFRIFGVTDLGAAIRSGDIDILSTALGQLFSVDYILLWLYLIFAISNAMMPSPADQRAWPAFLLTMLILAAVLALLGLSDQILAQLAQPAATVFGYLGTAFSLAIAVDILFMIGLSIVESLVSRIRGASVVYGTSESASGQEEIML